MAAGALGVKKYIQSTKHISSFLTERVLRVHARQEEIACVGREAPPGSHEQDLPGDALPCVSLLSLSKAIDTLFMHNFLCRKTPGKPQISEGLTRYLLDVGLQAVDSNPELFQQLQLRKKFRKALSNAKVEKAKVWDNVHTVDHFLMYARSRALAMDGRI